MMIGGNVSLLIGEVRGIQEYVPAKSGGEIGPDRRRRSTRTFKTNLPTNQSLRSILPSAGKLHCICYWLHIHDCTHDTTRQSSQTCLIQTCFAAARALLSRRDAHTHTLIHTTDSNVGAEYSRNSFSAQGLLYVTKLPLEGLFAGHRDDF
jgi:hypothetical protein